jgi:hypothetical protein
MQPDNNLVVLDNKPRLSQEASFQNPSVRYFFTARFAQGAKFAEEKYIFFSANPRGIGFAFHRTENKKEVNLAFFASLR